jgi:hypothetical protein
VNSKLTNLFLGSILFSISTGSSATLLLGPDLVGYSAVAGAALNISADSIVTDELGALAAIGIGARTDTANIYSATGAVGTGDGGNAENIYSGAAVSIAANANVKNIYALAAVTLGASGSAENIYAGAAITLGGLSTSLDVYAAAAITGGGATSQTANTNTNTAPAIDVYKETFDIDAALDQIASAQESLFSLEDDFNLDVGYANHIFETGVWKGSAVTIAANSTIQFDGMGEENPIWVFNLDAALVIGAATQFEIIRAGEGASIIWNLGGSLSLGAGTSFLGTTFISGAVAGATSEVSCGNLFTTTAIGIGSMISTNCLATDTWTGSINGLAYGIDITDGIISNKSLSEGTDAVLVSEPSTVFIIFSVALIFFVGNLKRRYLPRHPR